VDEKRAHTIRLVEDPWATARHIIEAVALIAAGVWAFYTFIYQEKIKPAGDPASLEANVSVDRVGHDATRDILVVSAHWHNNGKTEIEVAADGYNVYGDRYARSESQTIHDSPNRYTFSHDEPLISHQLIGSFAELRATAVGGSASHTTIEPGGTVTVPYTIVIPRGKYDVIWAQVIAVPVKTPVRPRIRVEIIRHADGSIYLHTLTPGIYEDDNHIEFGLLPD
jgi:hypothetical protein